MKDFGSANIWVRVNVNSHNYLKETDDLVKELKENYPVQYRKEWYPAACEGTEIIIQFFTDTALGAFLSNVVLGGIAYDITKSIFKKSWEALQRFIVRNKAIDIQSLEFVFDDITICIENVQSDNYLNLVLLFQQLHRHIKIFEANGIKDICLIRLPVVGEEYADLDIQEDEIDGYMFANSISYVQYDLGCNICYYNSNTGKVISK